MPIVDEPKKLGLTISEYMYAMVGGIDTKHGNWESIKEFDHVSSMEVHEIGTNRWWCTKCHEKYEQNNTNECKIEIMHLLRSTGDYLYRQCPHKKHQCAEVVTIKRAITCSSCIMTFILQKGEKKDNKYH